MTDTRAEAPDTWSRETYRVDSRERFTYGIDPSNHGGRNWNVRQIEMQLSSGVSSVQRERRAIG